jgi:hypothetical protein
VLTGITPVVIELETTAKLYHMTRGKNQDGLYDAPINYRRWPYAAKAIEVKNKRGDMHYKLEMVVNTKKEWDPEWQYLSTAA